MCLVWVDDSATLETQMRLLQVRLSTGSESPPALRFRELHGPPSLPRTAGQIVLHAGVARSACTLQEHAIAQTQPLRNIMVKRRHAPTQHDVLASHAIPGRLPSESGLTCMGDSLGAGKASDTTRWANPTVINAARYTRFNIVITTLMLIKKHLNLESDRRAANRA